VKYMRFCVMDVGQGSANYIELRNVDTKKKDTLIAAAIVDIGSEQWKTAAGRPSAKWIADRLTTMVGGAALDTVILSHSDSDHVNLIPALLDFFDPPSEPDPTKPVLTIKEIVYGGEFAKYKKGKSVNFLYQLEDYHPEDDEETLFELDDDYSSFNGPQKGWKPLSKVGDLIELWALSANTTAEKIPNQGTKRKRTELPDGGFATNTRSIVIAAKFAGKSIIATGDATGLTLAHCNELLKGQAVRDRLGGAAYMVTLPHHGSDTTTYDVTGSAPGSDTAKKVVTDFCSYVNADTISGSAGERRTFRHPSVQVITDFGKNLLSDPQYIDPALIAEKQHFFTAYFLQHSMAVQPVGTKAPAYPNWPPFEWWYTARSKQNLYTTDYNSEYPGTAIPSAWPPNARDDAISKFTPAPPRAISWGFIMRDDGTKEIIAVRERDEAFAPFWDAAEAVHGPLPRTRFVDVPSAPLPDPDDPVLASEFPPEPEPEPPRLETRPPPPAPSRLRQLP
jgi:hypothetical protein